MELVYGLCVHDQTGSNVGLAKQDQFLTNSPSWFLVTRLINSYKLKTLNGIHPSIYPQWAKYPH